MAKLGSKSHRTGRRTGGGCVMGPRVEVNIPPRPICPPLTLRSSPTPRDGTQETNLRRHSCNDVQLAKLSTVPGNCGPSSQHCWWWWIPPAGILLTLGPTNKANTTTLLFRELEGKQTWRGDNCGINQCGKPIVRRTTELLSEILRLEVQGRHCLNYSFPETIEVGNRRGNTMRL